MEDGRFLCVYRQKGHLFIQLDTRRLGPYRFAAKGRGGIRAPNAAMADIAF